MILHNFDVLLTFDRNLKYQQNFKKYPIPVIILNASDNSYLTLSKLVLKIKIVLATNLNPGAFEIR